MLAVEYVASDMEARMGPWELEVRAARGGGGGGGGGGDCRSWGAGAAAGRDLWVQVAGVAGVDRFSQESESDLAMMVTDFLENGSSGAERRYSSDSDSGSHDLNHLAERVLFYKHAVDQYEGDLLSVVHSLIPSISEKDLHIAHDGQCNASCIRRSLAKLLRLSGYDAAVCTSKWQGSGKVPGGDHEYIDVVNGDAGGSERFIIDIDFRSHFEIARAVKSYGSIMNCLPVVYVGSQLRLKQLLQVMVDAAKCSLKQNSMPLPPWRSLPYLQAKWHSKYERNCNADVPGIWGRGSDHQQCIGHLRRLKSSLQFEIETERLFKPITNDKKRRPKSERLRPSLLSS